MNYESLLDEAYKLGVIVKELPIQTDDGLCFGDRIAISTSLETTAEKACTLSEELGHYKKTIGKITDQSRIENRKQELVARRWGYKRLIKITDFIRAYKHGCSNRYEIADFLNVTEAFLNETIEYYRQKHGLYCSIDPYIVYFEPCFGIAEIY